MSEALEINVRPITDADTADVERIRVRLRDQLAERTARTEKEILFLGIGVAAFGGLGWMAGRTEVVWPTVITSLLAFGYFFTTRRRRVKKLDEPVDAVRWSQVREIRVRARQLLVVSDWLIFVTDGPKSFVVTSEALHLRPQDAAHAEVVLRQLWPSGGYLQSAFTGAAIPLQTLSGDSWRPPDGFDEDAGVLATSDAPTVS